MKKVVSYSLSAFLVLSMSAMALAQKTRFVSPAPAFSRAAKNEAKFASVGAYTDGRGVWVQWTMDTERNNFGFLLYRLTKSGVQAVPGVEMVGGSAVRVGVQVLNGADYNVFIPATDYRSVYYVESVLTDGTRVTSQPFSVQFVSDLTPYAGATSLELAQRAKRERIGRVTEAWASKRSSQGSGIVQNRGRCPHAPPGNFEARSKDHGKERRHLPYHQGAAFSRRV